MRQFLAFTTRNIKSYFRDYSAVFYSLLSMLIVIVLMVFFLGDMSIEGLKSALATFPNRDALKDAERAKQLIYLWTSAGIISINAVTVTLAIYSIMIKDRVSGKLNSIYTAPIKRVVIALSYIATAWFAAVIMCVITLAITEAYGVSQGIAVYTFSQHFYIIGYIMLNSLLYATIMFFLALLAKSEGAWSGMGTVIGTLVGFLGGIYIPVGTLSESIQNVLKATPVLYSSVLFRNAMLQDIMDDTFAGLPSEFITIYKEEMGIDVTVFEHVMSMADICMLLFGVAVLFVMIDACILKYSKKTDR